MIYILMLGASNKVLLLVIANLLVSEDIAHLFSIFIEGIQSYSEIQ